MNARVKRVVLGALFLPLLCGCGNKEKQKVIEALNQTQELIDRNAYVLDVEIDTDAKDAVFRFEAQVVDEDGNPIGKISGRRVENFGTVVRHRVWYDEVDPEEVKDMSEWERKEREKRRERWRERRQERRQERARQEKSQTQDDQ